MEKKKRKRMEEGPGVPNRKKILPVGRRPKPHRRDEGQGEQKVRNFRKPFEEKPRSESATGEERTFRNTGGTERPPFKKYSSDRPAPKRFPKSGDRPFVKREGEGGEERPYRKPAAGSGEDRPWKKKYNDAGPRKPANTERPYAKYRRDEEPSEGRQRKSPEGESRYHTSRNNPDDRRQQGGQREFQPRSERPDFKKSKPKKNAYPHIPAAPTTEPMRLNRYISQAGICSRRDADEHIANGKVTVNGEVVTSLGTKVDPVKDTIAFEGRVLNIKKMVYLLMNKPKNFITTMDDEKGRRTVMDIVARYTRERLFPVGRLDRNTTGLLLFTNDGELAGKLTHPSRNVRKVYQARLDRPLAPEDMDKLRKGFDLEDGFIKPDQVAYIDGKEENEIGIELHSGRNRIVRRMFEHLNYEVITLDRVAFGPLNKKELPRGTCRFLHEHEVGYLRMI